MSEGLKYWRLERGWTQKELADRSGVSVRMIQKYEQGDRDIMKASYETIVRLNHALQVVDECLIDRERFFQIAKDVYDRLPEDEKGFED